MLVEDGYGDGGAAHLQLLNFILICLACLKDIIERFLSLVFFVRTVAVNSHRWPIRRDVGEKFQDSLKSMNLSIFAAEFDSKARDEVHMAKQIIEDIWDVL